MQLPFTQLKGQREKNKTEKLHRIKEAARELFVLKGFDESTTREIAVRAGVGIGTVFTYAENKRVWLLTPVQTLITPSTGIAFTAGAASKLTLRGLGSVAF